MVRLSRAVPLEQLRPPETDVRQGRPQDQVQSLAASMGDPDVGQLQDVLVHPVDHDELEDIDDDDDLDALFRDGHPLRIVDGETRRQAAEMLNWHTLQATIVPEPPENTTIAQLDANTERIEMGEFETVRALAMHREETGASLSDMADKTGYSESYLSDVFSTMDSHEDIVEAWRHPEIPIGTSEARALKSMLTQNSIERYQQAGGLGEEAAYQRALEDVRLMIDVQQKHNLQTGEFRKRCNRCVKESLDQLADDRDAADKQAEGQAKRAEQAATPQSGPDPDPCMVCGSERPRDRRFAVPVCEQDYGMLSDMRAAGDVLLASGDIASEDSGDAPEPQADPQSAAEALAAVAGIPPEQAAQVVQQVQEQAQQAPQQQ